MIKISNNMDIMTWILSIMAAQLVVYSTSEEPQLRRMPEKCHINAELLYTFCCVIPPFFTRGVAKECGARFRQFYDKHNVTGLHRVTYGCDHWYCVLDKYGLIKSNGFVDNDKYYKHLDLWVTLNPVFTEVMTEAKISCKLLLHLLMPMKPCEFNRLNSCIRDYIKVECPVTIPTQTCEKQKSYYKDCGKYFHEK